MTTELTWQMYALYVALFILGQVLTIFWWDIPEVQKLAKVANEEFNWQEYWRKSWNMIIGLEVLGIMVFLVLDQIIHWRPQLMDKLWWMSGIFGIMGTAIGSRFGVYRNKILNIMDHKTDIADGKIPKPPIE